MKRQRILKILSSLGIDRAFRVLNKDKTVILMYHGVIEDDNALADDNWLQIRRSDFLKQMLLLKKHFDVIPLSQISEPHRGKRPRAVITFDDGYANNHRVAFPILKELNLPATIFLVTAHIDTKHIFWYDRLWVTFTDHLSLQAIEKLTESFKTSHPHDIEHTVDEMIDSCPLDNSIYDEDIKETYGILTSAQIEEMSNSGLIEFGCHTHRHEILTTIPDHEVHETLDDSVYWGAHYLDLVFSSFCAPNGSYKPHHLEILKKYRFTHAVTTQHGFFTQGMNPLEIPRLAIGRSTTFEEFVVSTSGLLDTLSNLKQMVTCK